MNDRFRFRVWDNSNEIWLEDEDLSIAPKGTLTVLGLDSDGETIFCEDEDCIVEQCTGLKDKNGKLIYEGDILKPNGNTITKEVVYEDGSYWAKDTIYFHDKCHIFQKWIDECGYEIIGNIHENQELLKEEQ